jgi:3-phenylpropionate/trans-cinnamate dioxygenase ferredoxin subunit
MVWCHILSIDFQVSSQNFSRRRTAMAQFVKVGSRTEFEDLEGGKLVEAGGHRIAVFSVGGSYYAIENTCPHRGGPLAEGMVVGEEVICPWHGSRFNVKTGSVLTPPARQGVESFPVRVAGDDVEVEVDSQSGVSSQ